MQTIGCMIESLEEKVGEYLVAPRVALGNFLERLPQGTGGISYAKNLHKNIIQARFLEM